ncbi:MAG: ADOP family duplicated permease [Vicinamibacterales bacterium]
MAAWLARAYRLLLGFLPHAFRDRFAAEMAESFGERLRRRRGRARPRFVARAFADLAWSVACEWARVLFQPFRRSRDRAPVTSRRVAVFDILRLDARAAIRSLRRRPLASWAIVLTLALGVGANAAVFRLVDAILLHPIPVAAPDRVVAIFHPRGDVATAGYGLDEGLSYSDFRTLEADAATLSSVAGFIDVEVGFRTGTRVSQVTAGAVSGRYFSLLGLDPAIGRLPGPADDAPGSRVVVLSDACWAREYDRSPDIVGQSVEIGGTTFVVVGVAPRGFRGTRLDSQPYVWIPITSLTSVHAGGIWSGALGTRMLGDHPLGWVGTLGRLADDASRPSAEAEVRAMLGRGDDAAPATGAEARRVVFRPLVDVAAGADRRSLVRLVAILAGVVGLTLAIAWMNIAALSMVYAGDRTREFSLRSALGAGRARLAAGVFTEHLLLAALGGLAALAVGAGTLRLLSAFTLPGGVSLEQVDMRLEPRVLVVTGGLTLLTALVIGAGPVRRAASLSASSSGALTARGAAAGRTGSHRVLIAGQIALTMALLVSAGLFVRSLQQGLRADLGFNPAPLGAISVDLLRYGYTDVRAAEYYDRMLEQAARVPGVTRVALATHVPLSPVRQIPLDTDDGPYTIDRPLDTGLSAVTGPFFDVMGIPLIAGRRFARTDVRGAPRVAVLNETAARQLFPGASPIGREVRVYGSLSSVVVGVVADAKYGSVRDAGVPMLYWHLPQDPPVGGVSLVARSDRPMATLPLLRAALQGIDPHVALYDVRLVGAQVDRALAPQRFGSLLLSAFAAIALAVAGVGIYGVVSSTVSQRTAEIGIRLALGASPAAVTGAVLGRTAAAVGAGLVLGVGAAALVAGGLERFLYGVTPLDGTSFAGAVTLLLAVAVVATIRPARRAALTDPVVALRGE